MRHILVHLCSNHAPTIARFITSMRSSGWLHVTTSLETQTGTHYIKFSREAGQEDRP